MEKQQESRNKPVQSYKCGSVQAAVWENEREVNINGKKVMKNFSTVSIERRYTDKDGQWKSTSTFRVNDLPKVALAASKAFEYIILNGKTDEEDGQ